MKLLTKKNVLVLSALFSVLLFVWDYVGNNKLCSLVGIGSNGDCPSYLASIESVLFIFVPVFVFSLITYFLREKVYRIWINFTVFWILATLCLILISPANDANYASFVATGSTRTLIVFLSLILYSVCSALVVVAMSVAEYFKK